jgi:putative methyltransferase (TIGR04325 family)
VSRLTGWDNEASASIWVDNIHQIEPYFIPPSSYAVLFWLLRLMCEGISLIDFGGSIGLTYYRYRRFASLPAKTRWIVVELPKIVEEGRRVAMREGAHGLEFETAIETVLDCDILLCGGALHYMERSVPGLLEMRAAKPPHVILNMVPLTTGEAYWTLQNYGPAIAPYRVYNEAEFIGYFEKAGYAMKDRWVVPESDCYVPFHPERCVREFAGFYFAKPE